MQQYLKLEYTTTLFRCTNRNGSLLALYYIVVEMALVGGSTTVFVAQRSKKEREGEKENGETGLRSHSNKTLARL